LFDKLKKNLVISLLLSAIIFFLFGVLTDFNSIINAFKKFNWLLLPILLFLSLGNYVVRFIKWEFYLRLLKIKIARLLSAKIFFSGLAMSASPAKMGEVLKSFLLKEIINEPITKTASIIFAERLTDFLSLTFLAIIGGLYFHYNSILIYIVGSFFIVLIVVISNRVIAEYLIMLSAKIPFIKNQISNIKKLYESAYILLQPKAIFSMFGVSIVSWFFECFGFYLIIFNFEQSFSILWSTFVYAFSIIAGAVSMLPGGLGITEGSLSLILIKGGIPNETAIATTLIIRMVTLWFAVILGLIVLFFLRREYNNSLNKTRSNNG